jgi:hypothetical protein
MTRFKIDANQLVQLESVDDVTIVDKHQAQPFPGFFVYSFHVRAKITTANNNCQVMSATAKAFRAGSTVEQSSQSMARENPSSNYYKTTTPMTIPGIMPGVSVVARVEAVIMCVEKYEADSAATPF